MVTRSRSRLERSSPQPLSVALLADLERHAAVATRDAGRDPDVGGLRRRGGWIGGDRPGRVLEHREPEGSGRERKGKAEHLDLGHDRVSGSLIGPFDYPCRRTADSARNEDAL